MRLAIVTDLDGTLLDHRDYSWDAARPALEELKARAVPLVLASSKTAAEIAVLHADIGLGDAPAIVENGAGIWWPGAADEEDRSSYEAIRAALRSLPSARDFRGFGDMTEAELSRETGLPPASAARARRRAHSEPGLWSGSPAALEAFLAELRAKGIHARRGGRFLTLSFGRTKADALAELRRALRADRVVALGDAPNDAEMLEAADLGIVVRNDHGPGLPPLAGEAEGRIRRTALPGPAGWNAAVLDIVSELQTQGDPGHG